MDCQRSKMTRAKLMAETERFETALHTHDPGAAPRVVVLELATEGPAKPELYCRLERFLLERRLREEHSESDEEALLDVLDDLSGWCHPTAQLLVNQSDT